MSWSTEDGAHEMWIAARFADGAISGGYSNAGYRIMYAADGTDVYAREENRPDTASVGWIGVCTCGWRSTPWTRVSDRAQEDLAARRAFGDYLYEGQVMFDQNRAEVEQVIHAAWKRHIEPERLLTEIAELTGRRREIDQRLATTVAQARKANTPWEDIGRAAGITRQSAWERWRDHT